MGQTTICGDEDVSEIEQDISLANVEGGKRDY